jgi:hypothetical protein
MAYCMRDIVPWSLVFAAQNERHEADVALKNDQLQRVRDEKAALARIIIRHLLNAPNTAFSDARSAVWQDALLVKGFIVERDVDVARDALLQMVDKSYGFTCQRTHDDINLKAFYCKQCLA